MLSVVCAVSVNGQTSNEQVTLQDSVVKAVPAVVKAPVIKPKKPKPLTKEFSGGVRLNTDGWSVFVEKGWIRSEDSRNADKFYDVRIAQIELTEHKHVKEIKETNPNPVINNEKPKPYIYGKVNHFYALKLGYGKRKMIAGKPDPGTVSIHWVYQGGLSIGLLKPYYLDAYVMQDNPRRLEKESIKYSDETKEPFLSQRYIVGSSGWTKGIGDTKFAPGIHAKTGLHFDFAPSPKTKLALEVGLRAELYTQKIEIMANQDARPYLFNAYVGVQFGKRY